jgi:hypothetical protein
MRLNIHNSNIRLTLTKLSNMGLKLCRGLVGTLKSSVSEFDPSVCCRRCRCACVRTRRTGARQRPQRSPVAAVSAESARQSLVRGPVGTTTRQLAALTIPAHCTRFN